MVRSGTTDITDELDDLAAPRGYHMRALKVRCSISKPCKGSRRRVESPPVAVRQADQISARYATMTVAVLTSSPSARRSAGRGRRRYEGPITTPDL